MLSQDLTQCSTFGDAIHFLLHGLSLQIRLRQGLPQQRYLSVRADAVNVGHTGEDDQRFWF